MGATASEPAVARAPEEGEHHAPLAAEAQEAAKITASLAFSVQVTGAEAESWAAAPHSPSCSPSPSPCLLEAHAHSRQWAGTAGIISPFSAKDQGWNLCQGGVEVETH